jgi:excisionase family DNA binding protein
MKTVTGDSRTHIVKRAHSIREIAGDLGVSKGVIQSEIKMGRLSAKRVGRRLIVMDEDLREYLEKAVAYKCCAAAYR